MEKIKKTVIPEWVLVWHSQFKGVDCSENSPWLFIYYRIFHCKQSTRISKTINDS